MAYTETSLFLRTLAEPRGRDKHAVPRKRLRDALFRLRERAEVLAGEIDRDLPGLTVHDISHLDALWEMADLIAGPDYPLNPLEAFALGAAFLLHDLGLGLAAWPGGRAGLEQGPGWLDALSAHLREQLGRAPTQEELASPPPEIERRAIEERLRLLHAERAEQLALATWSDPKGGATYYLIDDPDLRQDLGPLIGRIAHSHWWPVSRLGSEFGTVVGALPDCPGEWTIDPLKVAVLLRTADAAHLDERRAPGFLHALRRPQGISRDHWIFQQLLMKPRLEFDRLVYTTARPFTVGEVDAWWFCEETLRMVDREFHQVDALLADLGRSRLQARGVAGVDAPGRLRKYVEASGWTPVDARIHVSNVADLVRRLGGEQLYGREAYVPLRELIQNAADAIRARRLLEDRPEDWGRVTVRLGRDDQGSWIEVEDTGIGMSEEVLAGPLLDFGTTYWGSRLMRKEHEGLWARGFEPTGRFGIGFFSVFMWGHRVRVTTRPYQEAPRDTSVLEFRTGFEIRPLVRPAASEERLPEGGTRVRIWLKNEPDQEGGLLAGKQLPRDLGNLCAWLAPALDVELYSEQEREGNSRVVAASDWLTLDASELLARIYPDPQTLRRIVVFAPCVQPILDPEGRTLGRASISGHGWWSGVITVGGLRAGELAGIIGIVLGSPERAARDRAHPLVGAEDLVCWTSAQAELIAATISEPRLRLGCSWVVLAHGGDPGELPVIQRGNEFMTIGALARWVNMPDEVVIAPIFPWQLENSDDVLHPNVLGISMSDGPVQELLHPVIRKALAQAWGCSPEDLRVSDEFKSREVGRSSGVPYVTLTWIVRKPST